MTAVLFGSVSTLADTSELQREAFNGAFEAHGLDWHWSQDDYRSMLAGSGGRNRIAAYADERGQAVDADAVHQTKSELFQQALTNSALEPRPGVVETITAAKDQGTKIALVTTTSPDNVSSLLAALGPHLDGAHLDLVVDSSSVQQPKPDKAAYTFALDTLGEEARDCVAVEDNVGGVESAVAAGVACVAFPNENTADHDFVGAADRVERVDLDTLQRFVQRS